MMMPGRSFSDSGSYRYGFNGKEQDPEVKGTGAQYDYGMRVYDPRLGKFLSVDPLTESYPNYSPFIFAGSSPLQYKDLDGGEPQDFKYNWVPKPLGIVGATKPSSASFGQQNQSLMVTDPCLGQIQIDLMYDQVTNTNWFVHHSDKTGKDYYYKADNGNNSVLNVHNQSGSLPKVVGGSFVEFKTADKLEGERRAAVGNGFADGFSTAIFYLAVTLTTGGIGGSEVFGLGTGGKIVSGLAEDLIAQGITTGFNYKDANLTSFLAGPLSAVGRYGFVAKNMVATIGEFKINSGLAIQNEDWTWKGAAATASVGIILDKALDGIRVEPELNRMKFTRFSNLSYKSKFANQYKHLNNYYSAAVIRYQIGKTLGVGIIGNAASNIISDKIKNSNSDGHR